MKRFLHLCAAASALAFASTADAAIITPGSPPPGVFVVTGDPFTGRSPVTATIGNTVLLGTPTAPAAFSDSFLFTIGPPGGGLIGTGSGSIITSVSLDGLFSATDLDLTSVIVNGTSIAISRTANGLIESAGTSNVQIFSGVLNNITVNGISRGQGSYGGNLTFTPGAVPEPGTWAMMLLGFGAMGLAMRRRRATALLQAA